MYFWRGPLSNFAPTPGLRLPVGYHGHHEREHVTVPTVEHWFQACKATRRDQFDLILACGTAAQAKRAGRAIDLRPDWEQIKFDVMLRGLRGKHALEPYRSAAPLTGDRPLAKASPHDFIWGCRDADDTFTGRNLLGLALMRVRDELADQVERELRRLAHGRQGNRRVRPLRSRRCPRSTTSEAADDGRTDARISRPGRDPGHRYHIVCATPAERRWSRRSRGRATNSTPELGTRPLTSEEFDEHFSDLLSDGER